MISPQDAISLTPPSAWRVVPFWSLFRRTKSIGHADEELLSVYRDHGVVPTSSRDDNHNKPSEDLSGYQLVTEGALVTNKMKAWQGSIAISRHRGIVSPAYYVYQPLSEEHDQFLHYLLRSEPYIALYQRISKGVRVNQWDLEHEALRTIPVLLPDLATQRQIADFLDAETARVDALIEKKQRLVTVLEERRRTMTGKILSEGAKPGVPLRESGIDWLGRIPSHWSICPLKSLIWYQEGPGIMADDFRDEGIPLIRIKGVAGATVTLDGCNYLDPEKVLKRWAHFRVEIGDLLISASATRGGVAAEVTEETEGAVPYTGIIRIKPRKDGYIRELIPHFMLSSLFDTQIDLLSAGSTIQHFGPSHLGRMKAVLPPEDEQREIAAKLSVMLEQLSLTESTTNLSISRLREYRAALITAAVTGQIDVAAHARPVEIAPPRASAEVLALRPVTMPDRRTFRVLVAADVVHRLGTDPYLGRTKLQKLMFLAEAHANINDIAGRYQRYRYGPYDDAMVQEIELGLRQDGYYDTREGKGADREKVAFQQMSHAGAHHEALAAALGSKTDSLRHLVDLFKGKDTQATEAIATLYAVWNDALIDGKQLDDAAIIRGFLQEWHPEKSKFKQADLQTWLDWMRRHCLVPKGNGPRTVSTSTPTLFDGD